MRSRTHDDGSDHHKADEESQMFPGGPECTQALIGYTGRYTFQVA